MSFAAQRTAWKLDTGSSHAKIVLLYLCEKAKDHDGSGALRAWPGNALIAQHCEISTRSVRRALRLLEDRGLIETEFRYREDGSKTSSAFRLNFAVEGQENSTGQAGRSTGHTDRTTGQAGRRDRTDSPEGPDTLAGHEPITEPIREPGEALSLDGIQDEGQTFADLEREILTAYQENRGGMKKAVEARWPGSTGSKDLRRRIQEADEHRSVEWWAGFFRVAADNPTWNGENRRQWRASLAWLVHRTNFDKVVERWANLTD